MELTLEKPAGGVPVGETGRLPVTGYLAGVLISQVANNAMHLAQPLLIAQLSGSLSFAAFFSSIETGIDMTATFVGGWPTDRFGPRRMMVGATLLRAACLSVIPLAWIGGWLTLPVALAAYALDSMMRGFADTGVHALPLELAEGDRAELKRLNARYELVFDLGAVAGPAGLALLMVYAGGPAGHVAIPLGFVAGALAYAAIPPAKLSPARRLEQAVGRPIGGSWRGLRLIASHPRLLLSTLGLAALNIYPLRKLLSAFFAKAILVMPAAAGWVGAVFGVGGALGSVLYEKLGARVSAAAWVACGAAGVAGLAVGWIPGSLAPMLAAVLFFSVANVGARLSMTVRLQEDTPAELAGGVTAVMRWGQQVVSMLLKVALGAAFAMGAGPRQAFAVVGLALVVVSLAQVALALKLRRDGATLPG